MAAARPEVGDILHVVHDFLARSSDELSLAKGDRVELIERDDEFGDGWFLGRHMVTGNTGLFPEVYTRPPPKGPATPSPAVQKPPVTKMNTGSNGLPTPLSSGTTSGTGRSPSAGTNQMPSATTDQRSLSMPSNTMKQDSASNTMLRNPSSPAMHNSANRPTTQDHVLHETLTVIDEHITDLHSTPSNSNLHASNDSGSEYSSQMPERMSYIQGEETDEEDEILHTQQEVVAWTPDQVAEYLFTAGVEKQHCEVFRDQEISGEIILGMDQSSLFLKAFDLGSVGRRLKTWQKIKNLQDEVNGIVMDRRNSRSHSDAGSEDSRARMRSRTNTLTNSVQRLPAITDRTGSRRFSQTPKMDPVTPLTPVSPRGLDDNSRPSNHQKRPSAASIRDLHHSRRHSSNGGFAGSALGNNGTPKLGASGTFPMADGTHRKQPSFDRNWTMGNASPSLAPGRPLSSTGMHDLQGGNGPDGHDQFGGDVDRGYFSGTEVDSKKRNVLKKRDSVTQGQRSSYTEQQRARAATTSVNRSSRYGSMDASQLEAVPSASQKYFGLSDDHRRNTSATTTGSAPPRPPTKDGPSPIVTKLDGQETSKNDWLGKPLAPLSNLGGLRAISDSMTRTDRTRLASPTDSSLKDSPRSSTPSAGPSFELDSPDASKSALASLTPGARKPIKTKAKKDTSAYTRGLQKIGPREAIKDADYSGWMKKKSSHLMTTWKPRLFVLKGRRLSYYYSEDDTEEKGLIDISFHRVLPADNERLQGLHATLTGASANPVPADSSLETTADAATATAFMEKGTDSMFIFKLVPPRAGLNKAVTFTKPMVHYFALPNLQQGRMWMAALMKATIDRDDTQPMTSTYQQKTISLAKARQMRHRPPALMNTDDKTESNAAGNSGDQKDDALGISYGELDSAVSGLEKLGFSKLESSSAKKATFDSEKGDGLASTAAEAPPQSA